MIKLLSMLIQILIYLWKWWKTKLIGWVAMNVYKNAFYMFGIKLTWNNTSENLRVTTYT